MTTNKPGTVTQQPLFGCASCYEDFSYPADHLHVYNGECWCEICWDEATHEIADGLDWCELEPFKPALQAECEKLRQDAERYRWLRRHATLDGGSDYCFPEIHAWEYKEGAEPNEQYGSLDAAINAAMETSHDKQ